jgi:hypothetical protein
MFRQGQAVSVERCAAHAAEYREFLASNLLIVGKHWTEEPL